MKNVLRSRHFWIILVIMAIGAIVYYADQIPLIRDFATQTPILLGRYSTHRILSIIPVAYAAFIFYFRGGAITAVFISLALLPRALFISDHKLESLAEITAFLVIGLVISWLIDRQLKAVQRLQKAQQELQTNVNLIKDNEKRLNTLNQISSTVSQSLELSQVLNNSIESIVNTLQVDIVLLFLLDERGGELMLAAYHGVSDEFTKGVDRLKIGEGFNGRVAKYNEPLFIEDASKDTRLTREIVSKHGIGSALIVPLTSKGRVNGTLCVEMYSYRHFQPEEVDLLVAIGNQIGIAVENARLFQQQQTIAQQLRLSEERYRSLFENSTEAIFVCSTTGRIVSVNKACEQLTGYTYNELSTLDIDELLSSHGKEILRELLARKIDTDLVSETEELLLTRKDGSEAFIKLKISLLLKSDQVIGLQIIARDVSEERHLRRNMEYYISQITKAQEDERLRISRELHDDTIQILSSLSRGLDSIASGKKKAVGQIVEQAQELHKLTESALEGVRRFSQNLRPSILDDLGLIPAIEWIISDLEKQYNITANISITGNRIRLPREKALNIFRIVQEALTNVRKHSEANMIDMVIDFGDEALTIIISDNGQGFEIPKRMSDLVLSEKLGILGMRERARLTGGTLIVQSEPEVGTTLTLRIPLTIT